ncbi:POTE ankyrin domain family member B-like isoform X2 [Portunus trituberculatus]|uniref:POTE ankyrin domain family member B-like isoform X2 n=1 Tax=Portunus trituberculatus TaxID=210409 RepID=UPI001E1CF712|nr:POTE ankyrin domain family member B-like isoform X2 [Portunus trituberculatus]
MMSRVQQSLIRSIERGDGAGVEAAIEAGASVDRVERGGWAALHHAVASGNSEIVHLLMAYSASPDIRSMGQGEEGKTAVHWSALQGRLESLKILQENNCNLRAQVSGRGTALHYAAAFGDVEVVEWLVEQGVDITGKDKNGRLAKDVAKRNGHMHVHHLLKELAKRQPRNNKITKQDTTDHISVPVPKPRRRTLRGKKEEPRQESTVVQATSSSPQTSDSPITFKKKGWVLRSLSVGNKGGLKLQVEEMKWEMAEMEKALRAKDVQIARLQGDIFTTELEKVRLEEQLKEVTTHSEHWHELIEEQRHSHQKAQSDSVHTNIETQDRTALLLELQDAKARLEEEEHARASEKYASELKIASLTSELKEATQKVKKYGIRQKKLLGKNKTFEVDLTTAGVPSGLPDQGNAGLMNSIVQCLYSIVNFRDYLTSDDYRRDVVSEDEIVEALTGVFKALKAGVQPEILTKMQHFKGAVRSLEKPSHDGHLHDIHDLLMKLLLHLHHNFHQDGRTSLVSQLFLGSQEHRITCRWTGEDVSLVAEDFFTIHLDVTGQKETSLQNLLADHYQPLNIEHDCPHCLRSHLCRKQISVTCLPSILIIHLARKEKSPNVTFPSSHFMLDDILRCDSSSYELFGVVSLQNGNSPQYKAFCRNLLNSMWYLCSNEKVRVVNIQSVLDQPSAHILFYSAEII